MRNKDYEDESKLHIKPTDTPPSYCSAQVIWMVCSICTLHVCYYTHGSGIRQGSFRLIPVMKPLNPPQQEHCSHMMCIFCYHAQPIWPSTSFSRCAWISKPCTEGKMTDCMRVHCEGIASIVSSNIRTAPLFWLKHGYPSLTSRTTAHVAAHEGGVPDA